VIPNNINGMLVANIILEPLETIRIKINKYANSPKYATGILYISEYVLEFTNAQFPIPAIHFSSLLLIFIQER
jgi:hypothetical protein